ncbi:hypothetical protein M422DRAFT_265762 [Sphaerobolus stellatus SS14]|uniref:Unplaced genomic scaffold SPHSTscaffold_152, whole genome shotgun sequence n=1 Tax=Sphaerobolus stellatus (strain SS14) TaxID=990650 RepID=A0A0C9UT89_SPHS4|nr:hypothetical protein M422DRAFT_265762 [Sphaerobolus stellatus SS14]
MSSFHRRSRRSDQKFGAYINAAKFFYPTLPYPRSVIRAYDTSIHGFNMHQYCALILRTVISNA